MKRVLSSIVYIVLLSLAAPAFAAAAEPPESNRATETPREERARLVREAMDKLKQSNRALLQNPGKEPILLSDEEIMLLVPHMQAAHKKNWGTDITDAQTILVIGQTFFRRVLREDGIFGKEDRLTSNGPKITPGGGQPSLGVQTQAKLDRANRGLLQEPATEPIVLGDKEVKLFTPEMKAVYKENYGTDLTDKQAILVLAQLSFLKVLRDEGIVGKDGVVKK